jgi:hypothetical protein
MLLSGLWRIYPVVDYYCGERARDTVVECVEAVVLISNSLKLGSFGYTRHFSALCDVVKEFLVCRRLGEVTACESVRTANIEQHVGAFET